MYMPTCAGFGPVTSGAAFYYDGATGALTVTFSPASVAHRRAAKVSGGCLMSAVAAHLLYVFKTPMPRAIRASDGRGFVTWVPHVDRRSVSFLRGRGLKLVGMSKGHVNGRPICIVARPQICI